MPVTAKLSKRFYDVLGEDVANELVEWFNAADATYRADLERLNELNFTRFDAKLEQRIAELRAEMREGFARLDGEMGKESTRVDSRIDRMEARIEASIQAAQKENVRWMLGAWATLLGAMIALVKL